METTEMCERQQVNFDILTIGIAIYPCNISHRGCLISVGGKIVYSMNERLCCKAQNIFLWKCRTFSFPWMKLSQNFSNSLNFIEKKACSSGLSYNEKRKIYDLFFEPAHALKSRLHECLCHSGVTIEYIYITHHEMFYFIIIECERNFIMHQLVVMCSIFSLWGIVSIDVISLRSICHVRPSYHFPM